MLKKILCFAPALAVLTLNLFTQENKEKENELPPLRHEVVVTATRLETPLKEVASSITVISREDLDKMKKTTVLEALEGVLGLSVLQNGTTGGAASVFLRGANSEHTLIMLDGVELNDPMSPSRSFDLAHLFLGNIERIEVLRGPQSSLYGSDALGGVVNIITKKGQGKPKFSLSNAGGSYGTLMSSAEISGSTEKAHYSFGASYFRTDGLSAASTAYKGNKEKDGYRNLSLSGKFEYRLLDNLDFSLILRTFKARTDVDNFGGDYGDDPNNIQDYDALFLNGQIRTLQLKNRWEQKLSFSLVNHDRRHENSPDEAHPLDSEKGFYKSNLYGIGWQNTFFLHETNTLTFGIDYQKEQGESEYNSDGIWGPSSDIFPLRQTRTSGIYIQDQIRLASQFFATAGVRLDNHTQFGTSLTYRIAPAYFIKQTRTKVKATCGTGFKSPSLYQLYAPETWWGPVGNDDLLPEKSTAWDIGIEQQTLGDKILIGATYFSNRYHDLIDFRSQGFINIKKAESKGEEYIVQASPGEKLSVRATYTKTEAKDRDTGDYLLRRPKKKISANVNYQFKEKGNVNLSLIYIGERVDKDYSDPQFPDVTLPGYSLLNAAASYSLGKGVQIFFRLDNILNKEYEMIKGYGTPGFSAFGGLNLFY